MQGNPDRCRASERMEDIANPWVLAKIRASVPMWGCHLESQEFNLTPFGLEMDCTK